MLNVLRRTIHTTDVILGDFSFEDNTDNPFMTTLEPAHNAIKLPVGTYTCVRARERVNEKTEFETFKITGVCGQEGLFFHDEELTKHDGVVCGNLELPDNQGKMLVMGSRADFHGFMNYLKGVDSFQLQVL